MELPDLIRELLTKRGVTNESDIATFLRPDYDLHTHDPFLLQDMDVAVTRLLRAIEQHERIAVYADFDADGIPGAAVLADLFKTIGYANVETYIPHRDKEGYGFHIEAIETLASHGVSLIITVDVGTTAVDAVRFAREKNIDVIVTDHHEIPGELPEALAVLNPKRGEYPCRDLCGAAVAFKFVQATLREGKRRAARGFEDVVDGREKWSLDLVAIATVSDMVPLVGENRALVHWGLHVLRRSRRVGINALCTALRLRKSELTEDDIGFSIAPRINAASRMDDPDLAFQLLTTEDANEAARITALLEKLNAKRKGVVASIVRQARAHVEKRFTSADQVIVLGDPSWKPALLGLAANSIMAERGGVVCLWGRDAHGRLKGSCRSDGAIALPDLFVAAGDALEAFGGHKASGGFTVSPDQVHTLQGSFAAAASSLASTPKQDDASTHDALLSLPQISRSLYKEVSLLAPFGAGNPKPIFMVQRTIVTQVQRFGKDKSHVEVQLECRDSGARMRAYDFFRTPESFSHTPEQGKEVRVLATIERDTFRGGLALRVVDVMSAQ